MKPRSDAVQLTGLDTDLATLFFQLAARLRAEALALAGLAHGESGAGEPRDGMLEEMARSLERTADIVEGAGRALCEECRLRGVAERTTLAAPYPRPPRARRAAERAGRMAGLRWPGPPAAG
jgi:hypothetical protein